jgi:hypothetical protein
MTMLRLYRVLLWLYPARFVGQFGEEMTAVLGELYRGCRAEGIAAKVRFGLREVSGLLAGAMRERFYKRDRIPSGGTMRLFRFSRWIIVMMVLMFIAVNTAIEKGRLASVVLSGGQDTSRWWTIPGVFAVVFAFLAGVGLIGYCLFYVFRVVRLGNDDSRKLSTRN